MDFVKMEYDGGVQVGYAENISMTADADGVITFPSGRYVLNARMGAGKHYCLVFPNSDGIYHCQKIVRSTDNVIVDNTPNVTYTLTYTYLTKN